MSQPDQPPENTPLAPIGRYPRFSQAQERGLVAAAMDLPYWVVREGPVFVLYVEESAGGLVSAELEKFEIEQAQRAVAATSPAPELPKLETMSMFIAAAVMSAFWSMQQHLPENVAEKGAAANEAILRGEWWRTVTALTLHGDFSHFVANLGFGLLFGAFLQPRLGGGVAWLGIVISGALGNAVNAWFYRHEPHITIGASTAVFGGLGLLMAWEFIARWRTPHTRHWWQLVVPLGGGLALLAYLGAGDEAGRRTDFMAHFWGFGIGAILGGIASPFPRASSGWQWVAALACIALLLAAWELALRGT
jgi:membrane associated rhomboid family serine protease